LGWLTVRGFNFQEALPVSTSTNTPSQLAAPARSGQLERAIQRDPEQFRVLTGDRPTGPLHLGHLFGTLANRVRLQNQGVEVMVLIADYQTLTDRDSPRTLPGDVLGQVADYLATGIDPSRSTIFAHSQVPALNQLVVPFLSLLSVAELSRIPRSKRSSRPVRDAR
jgi:tryptophanyl-tRNA synthetase